MRHRKILAEGLPDCLVMHRRISFGKGRWHDANRVVRSGDCRLRQQYGYALEVRQASRPLGEQSILLYAFCTIGFHSLACPKRRAQT